MLCETRHRKFVEDIADFLTSDKFTSWTKAESNSILGEFIDYDAHAFFRIIVKLFYPKPWQYLRNAPIQKFQHLHRDPVGDSQLDLLKKHANKRENLIDDNSFNSDDDDILSEDKNDTQVIRMDKRLRKLRAKRGSWVKFCNDELVDNVLYIILSFVLRKDSERTHYEVSCFLEMILNIVVKQSNDFKQRPDQNSCTGGCPAGAHNALTHKCPEVAGRSCTHLKISYIWIVEALKWIIFAK